MDKPKEIVILSGKGGTGKTSLTAAFWDLCQEGVFCDCDVDAANLDLVLNGKRREEHEFVASSKPQLDAGKCTKCGLCKKVCRFDAIPEPGVISMVSCEGCGLCAQVCPSHAIQMKFFLSGHWYISETEKGPLVHARLEPGEENSGKLVTLVRQKARSLAQSQGKPFIITDGPPGVGCPVIASLSGADMALIVTEPTVSGIHDLERTLKLCGMFSVPTAVCINKHDLHEESSREIEKRCESAGIPVIGEIPYDENVTKAMVKGIPVTRFQCPAALAIKTIWERVFGKIR